MDPILDDLSESGTSEAGTASRFASWVYQKYNSRGGSGEGQSLRAKRMRLGQAIHTDIERYKLWAEGYKLDIGSKSNWHVLFADTHDGHSDKVFYASCLKYSGLPLRCKPDLVLRETSSGKIIIVERKVTTATHLKRVDEWGYARIRAQLWCYGWIDDWLSAPDVLLICEWWSGYVCSSVRPYWWRSSATLQRECLKYFTEYGGTWIEPPSLPHLAEQVHVDAKIRSAGRSKQGRSKRGT